eukprot:6197834-Pleurochrysis_carterae.AAC.9
MHAVVSTSQAANEKAEDGDGGARERDPVDKMTAGMNGTSECPKWSDVRSLDASTRNKPIAGDDCWCLWAQKELDARPHQRDSPCDRCACGSCG